MKLYNLNVAISCRDRLELTLKTIQSLRTNSRQFKKINIYVFDNYSDPSPERMSTFGRLLKSKDICYYSYDGQESTANLFPKVTMHKRWRDMMMITASINKSKGINIGLTEFYLLIDNDMIVGPAWDNYFISTANHIKKKTDVHYIVKFPGGMASTKKEPPVTIKNQFEPTKSFDIQYGNVGGGSGFWFMSYDMLTKFEWDSSYMLKSFGKFKQHDSLIWDKIKKDRGNINHVVGVIPLPDDPLIIHLGNVVGSMCNSLTNNQYNNDKSKFKLKENELSKLSIESLYDTYKSEDKW